MKHQFLPTLFLITSLLICQSELELIFEDDQILAPQDYVHQKFPETVSTADGNLHLAWVAELGQEKNVMYCQSADNGETFTEPVRVNQHDNSIVAYSQSGPRIKARGNELFIVYMDHRSGLTGIYMNSSLDNGATWGEDLLISDQPYLQAYPDIEVASDGTLHLVYYSFNQNYSFNSVRYAEAQPGTIEFSPSNAAGIDTDTQEPCDCCQPDLVITPNGDLYLAFRNNISNTRDHYIAIKTAESSNFDQFIQVSTYGDYMTTCPSSGPSMAINGNDVAVGYRVSQNQSSYINFADLSELSFNNEVNVNNTDGSQNFPNITLHNGFIHSLWIDYPSADPDVYYGVSQMGSGEMANVQRMNQNDEDGYVLQKDPKIHWHGDALFCFWSDKRGTYYQLYFRKSAANLMPGDINSDEQVDILDIIYLINIILNTVEDNGLADITGDGAVNILDVVALVNIILS